MFRNRTTAKQTTLKEAKPQRNRPNLGENGLFISCKTGLAISDRVSIRIFKILNFLARIKKRGDDKRIEKLDINEFQIISNKFSNLDTDNDCVLNKEQCITLVESIGYCHSSSGFVIINLFKNIHNYVHTRYIAYDFFSLHKNSTANIDFEKIIINKIIKIYAHEL
ncbi:uncharacterized protein LOC126908843 isoform X2 [Daktulosphaira vitifoliae]|uniref:uncharacterized protein LOC126908843 isoform X2 n=1 Tax=Daktulosphaira vitifoliae TaxID=58002 RepID=UPI0021A9D1CE|nr:uncharacterized protein LOC126908843 isoform X2 [Daktulosphaira vitifoliae]